MVVEGHITGPALLAHPLTERGQQRRIVNGVNRILAHRPGHDPVISQAGQEQARTVNDCPPMGVAIL